MIAKLFLTVSFVAAVEIAVLVAMQNFASNAPGVATIVTAVLMGIAAIIAAWAALKNAAKSAIAPVKESVDKIETSVNSRATAYEGTIAGLRQQVAMKDEVINDLRKTMAILAQAKAATDMFQAVSNAAVAGAAGGTRPSADPPMADKPVLHAIEKNTQDIAANTKKTDATVQALKGQTGG